MSNKRKLDRDGLEVYLLNLLLAYRPLLFVCGIFLLVYGIGAIATSPWAGLIAFLSAAFLLILSYSYNLSLQVARLGAWLGTHWRRDR